MTDQLTPNTPLIAAFTVMSGLVRTGERAMELTEEFGRRMARYLQGLGIDASWRRTGIIGILDARSSEESAKVLLRLVGQHDDRWEWQFWTQSSRDGAADPSPALIAFHRQLVDLAVAWEETEDVDAVISFERDYPGFSG